MRSLGRGATIVIDANRTYGLTIVAAVLQNHDDTLIDERPQIRVLAATFLHHRSELSLECRGIDTLRFRIQERVCGGQLQPGAGLRAIESGICINVSRGGLVGLTGDFREPSLECLD